MLKKIAVITPVSHIEGFKDLIETKGEIWYKEVGTKDEVRTLLLEENIDTIVCNPNKQGYMIDKELLDGTSVSLINTCSTGLNHIDTKYTEEKGIEVYCLKKDFKLLYKLPSTSELALTLMLGLTKNLYKGVTSVREYDWNYEPYIGRMLSELTVGIVGYGRLGKMMADFCRPLCKEIIVYDPYNPSPYHYSPKSIEELFELCDVISLHVHVKDDTKYLIDKDLLAKSKKCPYIINTSRGEIVVESDIVQALKDKVIAGYGADVLEDEFGILEKSPIIRAMLQGYNIIVTPHVGGMTKEGQELAFKWAINKL